MELIKRYYGSGAKGDKKMRGKEGEMRKGKIWKVRDMR